MERKELNGKHRSEFGKVAAKKCRKEGRIPAIVYDRNGKSTPIDVDALDFMKLFKSITDSTIVNLKLDQNDEYPVFIKDFQHDICRDEIKHVDFYEVEAGQKLTTKVAIRLEGSPEGIRLGGVLEAGIPEVEVHCLPIDLPERISVDVSGLQLNETIHVRDLKLSDKIEVLTDDDVVIATVKSIVESVEDEAETEETAEVPVVGEETEAKAEE